MTDQPVAVDGQPFQRQIGPIGSILRLCFGLFAIIAVVSADPSLSDFLIGLIVFPAAELAIVRLVRSSGSPPFKLYSLKGYALNYGIAGALWLLWPNPALLFFGVSLLLAVARGYAGCEILALSNLIRRRDDQLACAVFSPIDALENTRQTDAI